MFNFLVKYFYSNLESTNFFSEETFLYFSFENVLDRPCLSDVCSNFYYILLYNSEVWHIPTLKPKLKQIILSTSANALKLSQRNPNFYESFVDIHKSCNRAHPNQFIVYKHSILLHKMYNSYCPQMDWLELNFNQTLTLH